jgi:hypothetical protein
MDAANTESVRAIPKRRDFSDCFMWALLALSPPRARMKTVRPSRASRGSQVWRSPGTVVGGAIARLWDVRTRRSGMTPYFRPGSVRRRGGSVERAISGAFARVRSATSRSLARSVSNQRSCAGRGGGRRGCRGRHRGGRPGRAGRPRRDRASPRVRSDRGRRGGDRLAPTPELARRRSSTRSRSAKRGSSRQAPPESMWS